jgi:hypothetical protein
MIIPAAKRKKSFDLTKRTTRKLSSLQAYSRLYYKKKLKPVVDYSWTRHIDRHPELKTKRGESLKHRNRVMRELFKLETGEVKAEVEKRREEGDFPEDSDEDINFDDDDTVDATERQRRAKALGFQKKVFFTLLGGHSDEYNLLGLKHG